MQVILETESSNTGPLNNFQIGYVFFRVFAGVNLFFHGFMRFVNGISTWETATAVSFADTFLPMPLVHIALYLIPPVQVLLGACIALGIFTRLALLGGLSLFFILLFGHVVRMNWSGAHTSMHYGLYYWILLALLSQNRLSLDRRRAANSAKALPAG